MRNKIKDNKGITLVTLVITIVILIILASIGTYSGIEVIKSSKFTRFQTELKIMQAKTNEWYDEYKDDVDNSRMISELGATATLPNDASIAFLGAGKTNDGGYLFFSESTIENLDLNEIYEEFLINIKKREVISYKGFEYQGNKYYTLEQIPDSLYNVEHDNKNTWNSEIDSFDVNYTELEQGKYRIDVSNIDYKSGNINKWQVKYKNEEEQYWKQADNYSFIIDEVGNYRVKIANSNTESNEKQIMAKALLPSEYQQVEYIEADNEQYIDTGLKFNDKYQLEIKYKFLTFPSYQTWLTGAWSNSYGILIGYYCGKFYCYAGDERKNGIQYSVVADNNVHYAKIKKEGVFFDNNKVAVTNFDEIPNTNQTIKVFKRLLQSEEYNSTRRIYELKYYNMNNVLVRNYIPCYATTTVTDVDEGEYSEGTIGMYDIVNDQFYVNKGSGTFIKGNDIDSGDINNIIINDM